MQIHLYGVLVGVGLVVGGLLAQLQAQATVLSARRFEALSIVSVMAGLLGARIWHVITDWSLYAAAPERVVFFWNGGLSIIGALMAVILVWGIAVRVGVYTVKEILGFADAVAFGLPVGQAIGRLGNWVNNELYGLPTSLPWKLYIPPEHRLSGYESQAYYHPLFAYEAVALLVFATWLWVRPRTWRSRKIGTGTIAAVYLVFYAGIRFLLDFLRLQTQHVVGGLGINQVVLVVVFVCGTLYIWIHDRKQLR